MFKSKYYLSDYTLDQSLKNEEKVKAFTYDRESDVYENAIILPARRCMDFGTTVMASHEGGVCDENYNFIAGYSRSTKEHFPHIEVIRSYKANVNRIDDETVVYGGLIAFNHFGHFLVDGFARLWYAVQHKNEQLRFAFITLGTFDLERFHLKLLELIGIDESRIIIIKEPTKFAKVIVPKQAWYTESGAYNLKLFRQPWDEIRSKISPKNVSKIYLSRTKLSNQNIFGESYFEHFFESHGFKILYPEQMPIEEQISYVSGADEIACTYGTLAHQAVFAKDGAKFILLLRHSTLSTPEGDCFQNYIHESKKIDFVYIDISLTIFPSFHSAYSGYLIGPTLYWNMFLYREYGIKNKTDIFDYLDKNNIGMGSYIKLYIEKSATERNFSLTYGYRFNYVNYLKQLYFSYDPYSYPKMQRAMKMNEKPIFKERIFLYKRSDIGLRCNIKLLSNGCIWPISKDSLYGEKFWSFLKDRLVFLDSEYVPIVEFVVDDSGVQHKNKAKYKGAIIARIIDTCSLESYKPGAMRNWIIKNIIKYLVNNKRYKKLKHSPDNFFDDSKNPFIRFLGRFYTRGNSTVVFFCRERFKDYFDCHDMKHKVENLRMDMDYISVKYIDNFMRLSKYWYNSTYVGSQRTEHEVLKLQEYKRFMETFEQPFPDIQHINSYYIFDIFGLSDLPQEVLSAIDGKAIIDSGGSCTDTALALNRYLPNSEIHVYQPIMHLMDIINRFLEVDNCNNKIIPLNKGLGDKVSRKLIRFEAESNMADITTIDTEYQDANITVGLIKLDTGEDEASIIKGAVRVIARDKPVLAIGISNRPEDFFDLKDKIKAINPSYKFMVRKSEPSLPQDDLVLIAYN